MCPLRHRSAPNQRTLRRLRLVAGAPASGPRPRTSRPARPTRSGPGGIRASRTGLAQPRRHRCRRPGPVARPPVPAAPAPVRAPGSPAAAGPRPPRPASRWGPRPGSRRLPSRPTGHGPGRALVVGVVAVVGAIALDRRCFLRAPRQRLGPDHPDEWDARVAPIANWVEDERDLAFAHPVYVDFLTPAQYRGGGHDHERGRSPPRTGSMLDQFVGAYRAIGLAEGEVDLDDVDERGVRLGHARVLRPRGRAGPRARHRAHPGAAGHAGPRAHPRAPGPALRPDPALRRLE